MPVARRTNAGRQRPARGLTRRSRPVARSRPQRLRTAAAFAPPVSRMTASSIRAIPPSSVARPRKRLSFEALIRRGMRSIDESGCALTGGGGGGGPTFGGGSSSMIVTRTDDGVPTEPPTGSASSTLTVSGPSNSVSCAVASSVARDSASKISGPKAKPGWRSSARADPLSTVRGWALGAPDSVAQGENSEV